MQTFISTVTSSGEQDRSFLSQSLSEIDKTLSKVYAREYYDPQLVQREVIGRAMQMEKLSLPKSNTLTDALIRNTLGCDEKYFVIDQIRYAREYMQLIDKTSEKQSTQNRIEQIKKKFSSSITFNDINANSKPFISQRVELPKPVVDNEHEGYLKTQLIFLQKPTNKQIADKQYYEKYYDTITKKIEELGGMEDTLSRMEGTLKNNEMSNVKRREVLDEPPTFAKTKDFTQSMQLNCNSHVKKDSTWMEKSRQLRQQMNSKINKM